MLRVRARQCSSCIYRPDSPLDLEELERQIADPKMAGHFSGFRVCHSPPAGTGETYGNTDICCRGFWNRHKDRFDAGQLAQRLGLVTEVTEGNTT